MKKLQITTQAYQKIIKKIGSGIPEKGGVLMGKDGIITRFIFDQDAETTGATYTLNVAYLNPKMKEFEKEGLHFMGIVHSHPNGYAKLSNPDRMYFFRQFKNFPELDWMFTPIVFSAKQDEYEFFPYVFHKDGSVETTELEVLPNDYAKYTERKENNVIPEKAETYYFLATSVPQRRISIPKMTVIGILFSAVYFFMMGLCFGVLPIALLYIIKNILAP